MKKSRTVRLIATVRPSRVSRALQTSPMPPAPIGPRISEGPRRVPAINVMKGCNRLPHVGLAARSPARALRPSSLTDPRFAAPRVCEAPRCGPYAPNHCHRIAKELA